MIDEAVKKADDLFREYLKQVKGLDIKEGGYMVYRIKFKRLGYKYEAEISEVKNKKEAIAKLMRYVGENIKIQIVKIKAIQVWDKIIIPKGV